MQSYNRKLTFKACKVYAERGPDGKGKPKYNRVMIENGYDENDPRFVKSRRRRGENTMNKNVVFEGTITRGEETVSINGDAIIKPERNRFDVPTFDVNIVRSGDVVEKDDDDQNSYRSPKERVFEVNIVRTSDLEQKDEPIELESSYTKRNKNKYNNVFEVNVIRESDSAEKAEPVVEEPKNVIEINDEDEEDETVECSLHEQKLVVEEPIDTDAVEYMTVNEAHRKWKMDNNKIQKLCKNGSIPGVTKANGIWQIPKDTPNPDRIGRLEEAAFGAVGMSQKLKDF